MIIETLHGESEPTGLFSQFVADGSHNGSVQFSGPGYEDALSVNWGHDTLIDLHDESVSSATFTQFAADGSHNGDAQFSLAYSKQRMDVHDSVLVQLLQATILFVANFRLALNGIIQQGLSSTLGFSSAITRRAQKLLIPIITPTNRVGLLFTGEITVHSGNSTQVFFSSILTCTGNSFSAFSRMITSALSFIGNILLARSKSFTGALSFIGSITKRTFHYWGVTTLTLLGFQNKKRPYLLTSVLSFVDDLVTRSGTIYNKLHAATLSFAGNVINRSTKVLISGLSFIAYFSAAIAGLQTILLTAVLSFSGSVSKYLNKIIAGAVSSIGDLIRTSSIAKTAVLSFADFFQALKPTLTALLTGSLSFNGTISRNIEKICIAILNFLPGFFRFLGPIKVFLNSTLRFASNVATGWYQVESFIQVVAYQAIDSVIGRVERIIDKLTEIIQHPRQVQTIGTTASLIDLSDFSSPPPFLFIKNLDSDHYVEVDTSNTFTNFPQRIYPGLAAYLTPQTTTIYAKADTAPVDIQLMPGVRPIRQFNKIFTSGIRFTTNRPYPIHYTRLLSGMLSFIGNEPEPQTFLQLLTSSLGLHGSLPGTVGLPMYIQFDMNWHDAGSINNGADMIHVGEGDLSNNQTYVAVFPQGGQFTFWSNVSPFNFAQVGTSALNTWITIGMKLEVSGATVMLTPKIDATEYTAFDAGSFNVTHFFFGAIFSGSVNNFELDNLTIGSSGWGSSDIFTANFNDFSIVPPFDSVTGTGISASGGTLSIVNSPGTDAYADKTITWPS